MRDTICVVVAVMFTVAVVGCAETDEGGQGFDQAASADETEADEMDGESPETPLAGTGRVDAALPAGGGPVDEDHDEARESADGTIEGVEVALLAGKQLAYPEAWIAHAAANESECGFSRCPYLVSEATSEPAAVPPFERGQECMVDGGVRVEGGKSYTANAEAGAANAQFSTDVSSGEDFVELSVSGQARAAEPSAGGARADSGATLFADESALVLDIRNPTGEPVELEVSWDLSGEPVKGEASWQGKLWYTDRASRLDECYVAPDYQYDRVFDVFQDVGGSVRGDASGTARLPVSGIETADGEHIQVGLRMDIGAHAVARAGSSPGQATTSASRVDGVVRFRVVPADQTPTTLE